MKIQQLLATPDKWTKGALARTKEGVPTFELLAECTTEYNMTNHPEAVCWCLKGAAVKCYPDNYNEICAKIRNYTNGGVWTWNDLEGTTFQDIRELVEKLNI